MTNILRVIGAVRSILPRHARPGVRRSDNSRIVILGVLTALAASLATNGSGADGPVPPERHEVVTGTTGPTTAAPPSDSVDDAVEPGSPQALLVDLERKTDDLVDFSARIVYERLDSLTEEAELRMGRVLYLKPPEGRHRMGILLEEFIDEGGRRERLDQRYVFADGWLIEMDGLRRQVIKRQIVPPGSDEDPLRIGQGPLPLPIGQRKADVEARFDVRAASPPEGRLADGLTAASLRAMRLVPRTGSSEAEEYRWIDLHYARETLLPVLVVAEASDGSRRTIRLYGPKRNEGLAPADMAMLTSETPDSREWTIESRPWRP